MTAIQIINTALDSLCFVVPSLAISRPQSVDNVDMCPGPDCRRRDSVRPAVPTIQTPDQPDFRPSRNIQDLFWIYLVLVNDKYQRFSTQQYAMP